MEWFSRIPGAAWSFLGGASGALAVILLLGGWLGRRWEARAAARENAHHAAELERLKAILAQQAESASDALTRRREVYSQLAKSMRVLLQAASPASAAAKTAFLEAYDAACIWAPDPVLESVNELLGAVEVEALPGSSQAGRKEAYSRCMIEMRRDAGYAETTINYKFVTF